MNRTVLFLHGRGDDDPEGRWRAALDRAIARGRYGTLEDRDFEVYSPSWLDILEGSYQEQDRELAETHALPSEDQLPTAKSRYLRRSSSLERAVRKYAQPEAGILADAPTERIAEAWINIRMDDVDHYRSSPALRQAALRRVLADVPAQGSIVLIGHSLGSVLAVDLLFVLPSAVSVALFISIGSPLAHESLHRHLRRVERRFPYDVVSSWLNVVGVRDPITEFRGISRTFPPALDAFIFTGSPLRAAHSASSYLEHDVITEAFDWLHEERVPSKSSSTDLEPTIPDEWLAVIVRLQFAQRLERAMKPGERRARFSDTRRALISDMRAGTADPSINRMLGVDNADQLKERFSPDHALALLLELATSNPVAPYEIKYSEEEEAAALSVLAEDLGLPTTWPREVLGAERLARKTHDAPRTWTKRAAVAAGAVGLLAAAAAAPWLVLAAAPEGLTGAAAIVGGLAALGPGGMAGGIGAVGLAGGLAGGAMAVGVSALSAATVEEIVIKLQALAIAANTLEEHDLVGRVWLTLIGMEADAARYVGKLDGLSDDDSQTLKSSQQKLKSIRIAIDWLRSHGIGPKLLPPSN